MWRRPPIPACDLACALDLPRLESWRVHLCCSRGLVSGGCRGWQVITAQLCPSLPQRLRDRGSCSLCLSEGLLLQRLHTPEFGMSAGFAHVQCRFWLSFNCRVVTNEHPVPQTRKNVHIIAGHAALLAVFPKAGNFCLISGEDREFLKHRQKSR